jgi:hypothetical protein
MVVEEKAAMKTNVEQCRSMSRIGVPSASVTPYLLNRRAAASMLSISVRGLDYLIAGGRLKTRRIGGRVLVATEELQRFAGADRYEPMVPIATSKKLAVISNSKPVALAAA